MTRHFKTLLIVLLLGLSGPVAAEAPVPGAGLALQEVDLTLNPAESALSGRMVLGVPAGGALSLIVAEPLTLSSLTVNGDPIDPTPPGRVVPVPLRGAGPWQVVAQWRGVLPGPRPPAVMADGSFLPAAGGWMPHPAEAPGLIPDRLILRTPSGQRAVTTGALTEEKTDRGGTVATFAPYADEPPSVFAGPFEVAERRVNGLRLRTYFPAHAAGLADVYLNDTATHVAHFSDRIGPYPYAGFAVVAAPFPVGYGFPGVTYVSERILGLPFMRARSLPHEIVHSWWGNAVTPDYARGNWAEGLTTWMADYGLAAPQDQAAMRLAWLRDLAALPEGRDKPLRTFTAKAHGADQVIGYGKAAFVFHMLERRIGRAALDAALGRFHADHRGGVADWDDLRAGVEAETSADLGVFFSQWLTRRAAPRLSLGTVEVAEGGVRVVLRQEAGDGGPPYDLRVPVVVETDQGMTRATVALTTAETVAVIAAPGRVRAVDVDPDHDVLRLLDAAETPPILRDVELAESVAVTWPQDEHARDAARALLSRLVEGRVVEGEAAASVTFHMGLPPPPETPPGLVEGTARAWMERRPDGGPHLTIHADTADALRALVRPLPHYGQESWLAFDGARILVHGTWKADDQPLRRSVEQHQ